jgi:hypothetical protein
MKFCQYCGRENDDSAQACKGCGLDDLRDTPALEPSFTNLKKAFLPAFSRITCVFFSKQAPIIIFFLALICLMTRYVLCYLSGYYHFTALTLDLEALSALLGFILFPILLIVWIVSLFRRKHRLWTTAMLAGMLVFMGLKYILPPPDDLILYGMRDGMLRNYGLEDMRHFARDFDQLPCLPNTLGVYKLYYWNKDLAKTGLKEKYPFLAQCECISEADNEVSVVWSRYWRLIVAVNGKKRIDPKHLETSLKIIRASDDIVFASESD